MCKLCKQQEEDIFHVLLYCPLLAEVRGVEYKVLRDYVKNKVGPDVWCNVFTTKESIVQLIIDCREFSNLFLDIHNILEVEKLSRNLCYKLYNKRLSLLRSIEDGGPGDNT